MRRAFPTRAVVTIACILPLGAFATAGGCSSGGGGSVGDLDAATGGDGSPPGTDGAVKGNDAARYCVTVDPASYTKNASCTQDNDCRTIQTGEICNGACLCGANLAIPTTEASKYADAIRTITRGNCDCAEVAQARCIDQACALCALSSDGGCTNL
jgi:hypothetical protein